MRISIRPGIMVQIATQLAGVSYVREDIETEVTAPEAGAVSAWKTTKVIKDVAELEAAAEVRGKARYLVSRLCVKSRFADICPMEKDTELQAAIAEARELVRAHNCVTRTAPVVFDVMTGVMRDNVDNLRAIAGDMKLLLGELRSSVDSIDTEEALKKYRATASKLLQLGQLLDNTEQRGAIEEAVGALRKAAREVRKRVIDGTEKLSSVITDVKLEALDASRFGFLDFDDEVAAPVEALPTINATDLDLDEPERANDNEGEVLAAQGAFSRFPLEL